LLRHCTKTEKTLKNPKIIKVFSDAAVNKSEENFLNLFSNSPKVLKNAAVNGIELS
jgi:hypothetical protein